LSQGLLIVEHSSGIPGSGLDVIGDFTLKHRHLMTDATDYVYYTPAIDFSRITSPTARALTWESVIDKYMSGNGRFI
jgi:hypothetical protein